MIFSLNIWVLSGFQTRCQLMTASEEGPALIPWMNWPFNVMSMSLWLLDNTPAMVISELLPYSPCGVSPPPHPMQLVTPSFRNFEIRGLNNIMFMPILQRLLFLVCLEKVVRIVVAGGYYINIYGWLNPS